MIPLLCIPFSFSRKLNVIERSENVVFNVLSTSKMPTVCMFSFLLRHTLSCVYFDCLIALFTFSCHCCCYQYIFERTHTTNSFECCWIEWHRILIARVRICFPNKNRKKKHTHASVPPDLEVLWSSNKFFLVALSRSFTKYKTNKKMCTLIKCT